MLQGKRLALFDMDGVLYNSMPYHAKAWKKSMEAFGVSMSEEEAFAYEGMRGVETIKIVAGREWKRDVTEEEAAKMYARKSEEYAKFPKAEMIEGVKELQQTLVDMGLKVGVVTGSGQFSLIDRIRKDFEGLVSPDIIVTANDVKQGKPAPDPYIMGMKKGGCTPEETIVIENAPLGVKAGKAAGCLTFAINTGPLDDNILKEAGADIVVKTMRAAIDIIKHK